ncbi:KH domain-containing protein HEN4-like [Iris pallida]|uniref:KH domain-containing protein HEN4-like n=1 Tax=Iris pallida TaxID=29817 RepID=A0AAX6FX54_IRIPA|nr:KH domain-containing protein HEN4-like [Iris pallida]
MQHTRTILSIDHCSLLMQYSESWKFSDSCTMDDEKSLSHGKSRSGSFKKRSHNQFDNGNRKRRNPYPSHDQSSVTSKAIDTMYRILCPGKKIGSVLGKGGDIVNALRDETRAKILVSDAIPGAEERVIIIFNYPLKQQEELDNDENPKNDDFAGIDFDNMTPQCPAQDALLKVHNRIAADEYLRGGVVHEKSDPDEVTARILVPSNQVGCLIGKGGTVIQKLRNDYIGASIRVLPAEHLPACAMSTDELVQISGTPAIVKKALYDVSTRLHQHPRKENPSIDELVSASTRGSSHPGAFMPPPPRGPPMYPDGYGTTPPLYGGHRDEQYGYPPNSYNSSRNGNDEEVPEEFCIRILCPTGKIGGVIGKSGANVRQLEHQTRAKIKVEDTSPECEERIINVSSMEAPWDPISPTIDAVLQLQVRTTAISEDGTITTRLLVPSSKVGCLLGQRGSIINEMRTRTRADIKVNSKEEKPSYASANEELVLISGNHDAAREALLEIASRLRTRTFRSGNPGPVFPDRRFAPPGSMSGRGLPSSGMIGDAEHPPPLYSTHGFAPPENMSSRGPRSSGTTRGGDAVGYEYSKGHGPTYEAPSYHTGTTYEASSYRTRPTYEAPSYHTGPTYEATSYRSGPTYEAQGYHGPPSAASGYASMNGSTEVKIPNSAVSSVLGVSGSNISEISQISGARLKLQDPLLGASERVIEIHGSSEQMKAAQSLLQAFISSSGQNAPRPPPQQPMSASLRRPY